MRRSSRLLAACAVAATVLAAPAADAATATATLYSKGSQVAHLKRSSLTLHAAPGSRVVARIGTRTSFGSPTRLSVAGTRGNWVSVITTELPNGVHAYVQRARIGLSRHAYTLEIDLSRRVATVWRWGDQVRRFRVAIGAAATPTPVGVFSITDKLRDFMPWAYGCCVLALSGHQPNLPSSWTGGNRLAIHGGGGIGSAVSTGCPHARTADLLYMMRVLPLGSRVVIHP
jgi:lipoprotein-anchoring transpeptidase ErfK/SrfK